MSDFWQNFSDIDEKYKLDFGQGNTPVYNLNFDGKEFFIKDENKNPNGSFKDRGLSYQLARHAQDGKTKFVLSSSGNAAVSAAYIAKDYNVELKLFLGSNINRKKLTKLKSLVDESDKIDLNFSDTPRSDSIKFLNENANYTNLRGSTDEYAVTGFKRISYELIKQVPEIDSIFIPCSSGTSSVGIYRGFIENHKNVQIHICQTEKVNAISKIYDVNFTRQETSLADAITDKVALRKTQMKEIIDSSKGSGWVISDEQLVNDKKLVDGLVSDNFSYNSVLAFSGWKKALEQGYNFKNPVLLFSGL